MGTFYTPCAILNHKNRKRVLAVDKALVDTGSENTWIDGAKLRSIGVVPEKIGVRFQSADGTILEREVGFAVVRVGDRITIDEVVFALPGDLQILGARSLEGLNLAVDPARKRLIAAGPLLAAVLA